MQARRLLLTLAAIATLVAAGSVPAPAKAATRNLTVAVPKRLFTYRAFAVVWKGDTGPSERFGGGFAVRNRFLRGTRACPAGGEAKASLIASEAGSANVFHDGAFRGAEQTYFKKAGTVRLCSYLTKAGAVGVYELLYTKTFAVKSLPKTAKRKIKSEPLTDGTYTATGSSVFGGLAGASLTFVVAGRKVVSVTATGIPNTGCTTEVPSPTKIPDAFTSQVAEAGSTNAILGIRIFARFTATEPASSVSLVAGARSRTEIHGTVTADSADASCRGGYGFVAKR